jgi:hypothetical protein
MFVVLLNSSTLEILAAKYDETFSNIIVVNYE